MFLLAAIKTAPHRAASEPRAGRPWGRWGRWAAGTNVEQAQYLKRPYRVPRAQASTRAAGEQCSMGTWVREAQETVATDCSQRASTGLQAGREGAAFTCPGAM